MGKNLIPTLLERSGNLIEKIGSTFANDTELTEIFFGLSDDKTDFESGFDFKKPSWTDMLNYYPNSTITTEVLYEEIGGGLPENLKKNPNSWENSCAVRMCKALNYSKAKLPKAPSAGGNIFGKDKNNYWIRVKDLKKYLVDKLTTKSKKSADVDEIGGIDIVDKFKDKKGIIVFDVSGWGNASGHFTLWDGVDLKYVGADSPEHNDPTDTEYYYFNMNYQDTDYEGNLLYNKDGTPKMVKTTRIRLWELE